MVKDCVSAEIIASAELRRLRRARHVSRQLVPCRRVKTRNVGLLSRRIGGSKCFLIFARTTLEFVLVERPIRIDESMGGFDRTQGLRTKRFLSGFIAFCAQLRRSRRDFERI